MMIRLDTTGGPAYVTPTDITAMKCSESWDGSRCVLEVTSCSGDYCLDFETAALREDAVRRIVNAIESAQCKECGR